MSREEAIDIIRNSTIQIGRCNGKSIYTEAIITLLDTERKWIPWDSGRLPDYSGTYIVTAYDGVQERVTFAKYQKRLKRWELTGARAFWRVLAWMPLPEPYEEGNT